MSSPNDIAFGKPRSHWNGRRNRVLIVGAGPVGLCAAMDLKRRGMEVTVVETSRALPEDLRASTFHPPTLDMLEPYGITARLIADGLIARTWQFRDRSSGPIAIFDLALLAGETSHPYRVQCEQFKLTRYLYETVRDAVRLGCSAVALEQNSDTVSVELQTGERRERVEADWVIAADGARSTIRKALGIEFEGFTFPELFLVVSTPFRFEERMHDLSYINYISDPEEWFVLLRVPTLWRVLFPTDPAHAEDEVEPRLNAVLRNDEPYEIVHRTLYNVHQRVASAYRKGRVFLAGDSAHINNPLGGMGLNGGIHDALNLTEKLAAVANGADPRLLALYERQRRPIAVDSVQQQTMRNRDILAQRDPKVRAHAHEELRRTAADPARAKEYLLRSSMISGLRRAAEIA